MSESQGQSEHREEFFAGTARSLADVGTAWARHGLAIGKTALETSAQTLRATAEMLGRVSERLACADPCCEAADSTKAPPATEPTQQA